MSRHYEILSPSDDGLLIRLRQLQADSAHEAADEIEWLRVALEIEKDALKMACDLGENAQLRARAEEAEARLARVRATLDERGLDSDWSVKHAVDDHLCDLDHKDEMDLADMVAEILALLDGEPEEPK